MARKRWKGKGLDWYHHACGWWRSPEWRQPSLAAVGLHTCAVSYCHEHQTDGRIPGNPEDLALALGVREREVAGPMEELLAGGKWQRLGDDSVELVGYLEEYPSSDEIAAKRDLASTAGARGNHKKWHVERGIVDPDCGYCIEPPGPAPEEPSLALAITNGSGTRSPTRHEPDRPPDTNPIAHPTRTRSQNDRVGIAERSHSRAIEKNPPLPPQGGLGGGLVKEAIEQITEASMAVEQERGVVIQSPPAWRRSVARTLTDEIGPALVVMATKRGITEASALVDAWAATEQARAGPRSPAVVAGARSLGESLWSIDDRAEVLGQLTAKLDDEDLVDAGLDAWESARATVPVEVQA